MLEFSAEPGVLLSTAVRPPGFRPPAHPFLNGQALDARAEHRLGELLSKCHSADEFIGLLEADGFEVKRLG